MADRIKPVEAAKRLNTAPQRIYNLIKQGRVKTFPNPSGKVALVDFSEVKMVLAQVKQRGPRKEKSARTGLPRGLKRGSIISQDRFPTKGAFARPDGGGKSVRTVTDATSQLVWLSDGTVETTWGTERLAKKLQDGTAHIESVPALLGMIIYQWKQEGNHVAANDLESWLVEKGIGYFPIETPHKMMEEEEENLPPKPTEWVEVELTEEGIDMNKVALP